MTTRKPPFGITESELIVSGGVDADNDQEESFQEFQERLKSSESAGTLRVFRLPTDAQGLPIGNAKNQSILGTFPIDRFSYDELISYIQKQFIRKGETTITCRLYGWNANDKTTRFNKIVVVERENDLDKDKSEGDLSNMFKLIQDNADKQNARIEGVLREALAARTMAPAVIQKDPMDFALQLVGIIAPLMGARTGGGTQQSLGELVGTIKAINDLRSDLKGENEGGESEGSEVAQIIRAVAPIAQPVVQKFLEQQQAQQVQRIPVKITRPPPQPRPAPNPAGSQPVSQPVTPEMQRENAMLGEIKKFLPQIIEFANGGQSAVDVASFVLDSIPPQFEDDVYRVVSSPAFIRNLILLDNRVSAHQAWFEALKQAILADFTDDESPETETPAIPTE